MSRAKRMAPGLAANWARVARRIQSSSHLAVFLDFDGTLVDPAPLPHLVRMAPATRRVLRRLARHPRVTIVIVSGRRRHELRHYVDLRGILYYGLYGWERQRHSSLPQSAHAALRSAQTTLSLHLASFPGMWIEDKQYTFSVHLLDVAPPAQRRARRRLRSLLLPFRKTLRVFENLRDVEIVPRCIRGKGEAVRQFLAKRARRPYLPIYFGDDHSDESAFQAVQRGISIRVGAPRPTRARYSIRNPAEVASALVRLMASLG